MVGEWAPEGGPEWAGPTVREAVRAVWGHLPGPVAAGGDVAAVLTQCRNLLYAQRECVTDEVGYGWARTLVALLGDEADVPYLPRVPLGERDAVLGRLYPNPGSAAVALPVLTDTSMGELVLVARRPDGEIDERVLAAAQDRLRPGSREADERVLAYAKERLRLRSREAVLFGAPIRVGEAPAVAALRGFGTEAGIAGAADLTDPRFDVWQELVRWTAVHGTRFSGYLLRLPADALTALDPDPRAVDEVGLVPLGSLLTAPMTVRPQLAVGRAEDGGPRLVGWFDSPVVTVRDADGVREWEITGLAGAVVAGLRARYPDLGAFRQALARRVPGRARTRRVPTRAGILAPDAVTDLVVRSYRVRALMDHPLGIVPPPVIPAPLASAVCGEPAVLMLDARLPLGGSTTVRGIAGLLQGIVEARAERSGSPPPPAPSVLSGLTLLVAPNANHATAVAALAESFRGTHGVHTWCEFFVPAGTPADVVAALNEAGEVTVCAGTRAALDQARGRERQYLASGRRAVLLPGEPDGGVNDVVGLDSMDSAAGFATLLHDIGAALHNGWSRLRLPGPRLGQLYLPPTGSALLAAGTAAHRALAGVVPLGALATTRDAARPPGRRWSLNNATWSPEETGVPAHPVNREATELAQAIIALDTGLWPEPAGAAGLGARLLRRYATSGQRFARALAADVTGHPLADELPDLYQRIAAFVATAATVPGVAETPDGPAADGVGYLVNAAQPGPKRSVGEAAPPRPSRGNGPPGGTHRHIRASLVAACPPPSR
jgi:hypothetical protein